MQSLKTYLLEGLIQAALLLSLCGVRVQVGVEPEQSLLEPGPTSAVPPVIHTQLLNLRNTLDDGESAGLHPKSPDLDQFFTTRRLLGWVRSLDRLQVPAAELETWLVQQDSSPLPVRLLHDASDGLILPEQRRGTRRQEEEDWAEPVDEWEEPEHNHTQVNGQPVQTSDGDTSPLPGAEDWDEEEEEGQTEEGTSSASLQECLRLLENFPLPHEQQEPVCNTGTPRTESPQDITQGPPLDMEQDWQDLMDLMEPQASDVDMVSAQEASDAQVVPQAEQVGPLMDGYLQHDFLESTRSPDQELLPLVPSDQLDDQSAAPSHTNPAPQRTVRRLSLLTDDLPPSFLLDEGELEELLRDTDMLEDMGLLELDLQAEEDENFSLEMTQRLEQEGYLDSELTQRTSRLSLGVEENTPRNQRTEEWSVEATSPGHGLTNYPDLVDELDSDSGLSLDSSHSPLSPSDSEASYSSSSSSTPSPLSTRPSQMELQVTIKEEPLDDEEELGAVGGHYPQESKHIVWSPFYPDQKLFRGFPWSQHVTHDHTYNQPSDIPSKTSSKHLKSSPKHENAYKISKKLWNRDERHARTLKIPFSNELITNLPVEEFNDLLASYQLNEDQLNLIRDIRRRGKNKIAAQNCRKRKMDTLVGLEKDVTMLKRRKSQLLKEKQQALRTLQELKQRMTRLYEDVFSGLRDAEGRPLDVNEFMLSFDRDGSVDVVSRRQGSKEKRRRKQKDKK